MKTTANARKVGKDFASDINVDCWEIRGEFKAGVSIGEEYYESEPYKSKEVALCEIKGWLEGVQVKIEGTLNGLGV